MAYVLYKTNLEGISGGIYSGEMLAIMGSSGSGKSSLLNILASRLQKGSITGKVSFNGDNLRDRSNVAYVAQEDTFYGSLTCLLYTSPSPRDA